MTAPQFGARGLGVTQHIAADRMARANARLDADLEYAEKAEVHVWVALVAHRLSDNAARTMATGESEGLLDAESVSTVGVGCYRCERTLEPRLVGKRCRGAR